VADHLVGGLHCADASELAAAFVLGALEAAEMDAVRLHLAGCPEAHAEFAELGSVVPALFETVDVVEPPATLRDRILAAAAANPRAAGVLPAADAERAPGVERAPDTRRAAERAADRARDADSGRRRGWLSGLGRPVWAGLAAAAALALVALGAWNVQLRDEIAGLTSYRNGVAAVLDQAAQQGARLAVLSVPDSATGPSGLAAISSTGTQVSLVMRDLAPTTGSEVYEAWVITGDNAPVPIGHFTVDASGTATFVTTGPSVGEVPAITVALTREPGPGATTPTMPIIALGTAAAS
jgi:hypothetical protein